MFYTGINPFTGKKVYCTTDYHEKQLQRALLQWNRPQNADLVREALLKLGRSDLIGFGKDCLVKPENRSTDKNDYKKKSDFNKSHKTYAKKKKGWAQNKKQKRK